ncbi:MAG: cell division protein ZapB [Candidatus Zixiibacteriota bacterium]|nr:MAG: cell division protein ZapB [candidate division Zixibacteria bacterium]
MDTLGKLEEKIAKAVSLIEKLSKENNALSAENERLKTRLADVESKFGAIEADDMERTDRIKTKLNGILEKLETLEQI